MGDTIVISKDLTWRDLDGELVVLNSKSGDYHTFNSVGRSIWLSLAESKPVDVIQTLITNEFDIDSQRALDDIQNFIQDLTQRGLLSR